MNVQPLPLTTRQMLIATSAGAITGIFAGVFSIAVGAIAFGYAVWKKSSYAMLFAITTTLMGVASYIATVRQELAPSPMFFLMPTPQPSIVKEVVNFGGVASSFRVVDDYPENLHEGDVWFSKKTTQFEGYDGESIVILG